MSKAVLSNNKIRMKESNENLVLSTLEQSHTATCAEISRTTGLSVATCGNILKRLLASGEILEGDYESQSSGRPAKQYSYNENFSLVTAITLQETESGHLIQHAIANLYGTIIEKNTEELETISPSDIDEIIHDSCEKYPNIKAVGLGVPSVIDRNGTIVSSDIAEIDGMNLADLITIPDPTIKTTINSSPAVSIYGYHRLHPELKDKVSVSLICPTNLGAGIVVNEQIYNGDFNIGGEINFIANNFLKKFIIKNDSVPDHFEDIMFSITALISTINPSSIVLMGSDFSDTLYHAIRSCCEDLFPGSFMPDLVPLRSYKDVYLHGAIQIAIDLLKPKVKLVAK